MKLTINEIATMANVSKGTVSKVLNGYKGINEKTRDRILQLVDKLDFQQDSSARALALQKTGAIGLLIPHEPEASFGGFYWSTVLSAISRTAVLKGTNLLVMTAPREGDIKVAVSSILRRGTVDGLIIASELLDKQSLATLVNQAVPIVLQGQNPVFRHNSVDFDNALGTQAMIRHMVGQGYRKIGAIFGPKGYPYVQERYTNYLSTLKEEGIHWSASFFAGYFDPPSVETRLNTLLDEHPDMDCLFVSAAGEFIFDVLKVLRDRHLEVPRFGIGVLTTTPFLSI